VNPLTYLDDLVARVIMGLHSAFGGIFGPDSGWAWGLAIAVLVLFIRLCLVPLFVKQIHAQRKMAEHAPYLQELRKKYKNDKQRLQEETMKFYKENGVNPLAGCLPMIPQMIVFFSLFSVLRAVTNWKTGTKPAYGLSVAAVQSAQKAKIFGVHLGDKLLFPHTAGLGATGSVVIAVTVVVSATTTFMSVRQSAKRGLMQTTTDPDNPMAASQKYMMYVVPFFSLTGLYWQYGLVLYWVTTNVWTMGQQYIMFRNWTPPETAAAGGAIVGAAGASAARAASGTSSRLSRPARPAGATGGTKTTSTARTAGTAGTARTAGSARTTGTARTAGTADGVRSSGARPAGARSGAAGSGTARSGAARSGAAGSGAAGSGTARSGAAGSGAARSAGTGKTGGSGSVKTGDSVGTGDSVKPSTSAPASQSQNGSEKRGGLLRLGRSKPEPEPEPVDDTPVTKVIRQQPTRQARSKRSGKR
jgi:YidC/Oxa1 family membrane protein insertase